MLWAVIIKTKKLENFLNIWNDQVVTLLQEYDAGTLTKEKLIAMAPNRRLNGEKKKEGGVGGERDEDGQRGPLSSLGEHGHGHGGETSIQKVIRTDDDCVSYGELIVHKLKSSYTKS